MPAGLPSDVRKLWKDLVPVLDGIEILSSVDASALADFCVCLARLQQCEKDISERGILVDGERGMVKNPSCQLARQYRVSVQAWASQFCMTPVARARLNVTPDGRDPNSPWASFRRREPESLEDILSRPRTDARAN